ncbi:MAG: prolyl oligopeptidase family serine peptidase [Isosphaeraceae bacterium]
MRTSIASLVGIAVLAVMPANVQAQPAPGDTAVKAYLARLVTEAEGNFPQEIATAADWERLRPRYRQEYLDMLGLWPLPDRTPLAAKVTGTVEEAGVVVEKLHYQSVPGLYVTANLYRPAKVAAGEKLPAILYVCGHSGMGRDGVKTAFQTHGIWFARHGYVCLIVDTLQLGEIAGIHHGTYREGRWWWHSRGYTSAGVECWNGVRGLDYLESRPEVDPARLAVTGISGGGAATFWVAAADDRVKVAAPVSGMADLHSYVDNQVVNGHCDCMFLYNTYQWPWTRIAGLIAPRPLLFVNSDADAIFPMDANERVIARLERLYSKFGASDRVDAVVSVGGHAYRKDILQAVYRFMNTHLKGDPRPVDDADADFVSESRRASRYPIDPKRLRVFPEDSDIPADQKNQAIDQTFVPVAKVELPAPGGFESWKEGLVRALRERSFRGFPDRAVPARVVSESAGAMRVETEPGIVVELRKLSGVEGGRKPRRVVLVIADDGPGRPAQDSTDEDVYELKPRGYGSSAWTRKNPPNTVERSLSLLGRTADSGRVRDVAAAARWVEGRYGAETPLAVGGRGGLGVVGAYAALLEPSIDEVELEVPPASHGDAAAPQFLGVLRTLDVPDALGLLAPRRVVIRGGPEALTGRVVKIFERAGASDRLQVENTRPN